MQVTPVTNIPEAPPQEMILNQEKFDRGVIDIIDQTKLPRNALLRADNIKLDEDGAPRKQDGVAWYGAELPDAIDGVATWFSPTAGTHLIAVADGQVYRSTDHAQTWELCSGGTLAGGHLVDYKQAREFTYLYDGVEPTLRYDGTTTLQQFNEIAAPTSPGTSKTGLSTNIYTYYYRVSAVNEVGSTEATTGVSIQVSRLRQNFDASNYVTFSWTASSGATRYDIYVGRTQGEERYIDTVEGATSYIDQGQSPELITSEPPEENTTGGPVVGDMELVGDRLVATRDKDRPYRVWISGAGPSIGKFSYAYDATWTELQRGSQFLPMTSRDYRDGRGEPLITVWYDSADGLGCVWQGKLEEFAVDDIRFPVPAFYKLPGSRGTNAPLSVINVLNDYVYYNQQAAFNIGSRAQFLNLLSTDEITANIRNFMLRINANASHKIVSHFQDGKIYMSVPFDSDKNSVTIVHDTTINGKPWLPRGFTMGFARFLRYKDDNAVQLLAFKEGDKRLSIISKEIGTFYGQPIPYIMQTGLRQINEKDRFDFMDAENAEFEFARPRGRIEVILNGITREDGFTQLAEPLILEPSLVRYSWSRFPWTTMQWTKAEEPEVLSEPTLKRYFYIGREINAYQYTVKNAQDPNSDMILRLLQVRGRRSNGGSPPDWELFRG